MVKTFIYKPLLECILKVLFYYNFITKRLLKHTLNQIFTGRA